MLHSKFASKFDLIDSYKKLYINFDWLIQFESLHPNDGIYVIL